MNRKQIVSQIEELLEISPDTLREDEEVRS